MKRLLQGLLRRTPYAIVRRDHPDPRIDEEYDLEHEARAAIRRVRERSMVADAALITLYQQVAFCERQRIEGAFVECGVWKGGAVALMALANLAHGKERRMLHLFDSFQGIPEPNAAIDGAKATAEMGGAERARGRLRVADDYAARGGTGSVQEIEALLAEIGYERGRVRFHPGWFQDTVPAAGPDLGAIAILRLDGDWYESTKVCLEGLYDNVVPGGFVIIDDYGCYDGCRRATDEFMARLKPVPFLHHVTRDVRQWQKLG